MGPVLVDRQGIGTCVTGRNIIVMQGNSLTLSTLAYQQLVFKAYIRRRSRVRAK